MASCGKLNAKLDCVGDEEPALSLVTVVKIGSRNRNGNANRAAGRRKSSKSDFGGCVETNATRDEKAEEEKLNVMPVARGAVSCVPQSEESRRSVNDRKKGVIQFGSVEFNEC